MLVLITGDVEGVLLTLPEEEVKAFAATVEASTSS
jgi:hypothetical protein